MWIRHAWVHIISSTVVISVVAHDYYYLRIDFTLNTKNKICKWCFWCLLLLLLLNTQSAFVDAHFVCGGLLILILLIAKISHSLYLGCSFCNIYLINHTLCCACVFFTSIYNLQDVTAMSRTTKTTKFYVVVLPENLISYLSVVGNANATAAHYISLVA